MAAPDDMQQKVLSYLNQNKLRLLIMTVSYITIEVRSLVPGAQLLDESYVSLIVSDWLSNNGPRAVWSPYTPPHPASSDSRIVDAVKNAVKTLTEGIGVSRENGKINVNVTGLTAELMRGTSKASVEVSWGGSLSVETNSGDFHLSGELSSTRWQVQLSYPDETSVPNLATLGKVFGEAEKSMQGIVTATSKFKTLGDIPRIKDAVSPNIQPVKDAVEAVDGIANTPAHGISFGISIGSPDPQPGQTGMPSGYQVQATLTLRF